MHFLQERKVFSPKRINGVVKLSSRNLQRIAFSWKGSKRNRAYLLSSLLEELDIVPASYFKKLVGSEGIWECRIQFGSDAYRIFCFFEGNSVVVLTHGLIKKTQKTPKNEIERAEAYRREYLKRRGKV